MARGEERRRGERRGGEEGEEENPFKVPFQHAVNFRILQIVSVGK